MAAGYGAVMAVNGITASQTQTLDGNPIVCNAIVWSQTVEGLLHHA